MQTLRTIGLLILAIGAGAHAGLLPEALRCNARVDPLGVDTLRPVLSWTLRSADAADRGQFQRAYRVLVATSAAGLEAERGDLWDSGRVPSADTLQVRYAGRALAAHQACWWKVQVWDRDERASALSAPARWRMGILEGAEWHGEWIGFDAALPGATDDFGAAAWIWYPEATPPAAFPAATRSFRREFVLRPEKVTAATCLITVDDQFELLVNGRRIGGSDGAADAWRRPQVLDVGAALVPGANSVTVSATNASPGFAGLLARLQVRYADGQEEQVLSGEGWVCSAEGRTAAAGEAGTAASWKPARVLGKVGMAPWGVPSARQGLILPPAPLLRREFRLEAQPVDALLYVAALGSAEVRLNGTPVSADVFATGWADYRKRCWTRAYDVTGQLQVGVNAMGVVLGDGWYAGYLGYGGVRNRYGGEPRVRCLLRLTYADGRTEELVTDRLWQAAYGPVLEGDLQMGETYDARRELTGWDKPGFAPDGWQAVTLGGPPGLTLANHPGGPVRRQQELAPAKLSEVAPGVSLVDLGQNLVGWARLKVRGAAPGQRIRLRFGEILNPDGSLHTANLRGARATDTYVCRGDGAEEVWEPRFTFHGFRYVEVSGYPGPLAADAIAGIVVHSDLPPTGSFECGNAPLNRLYQNILWGQRGNFLEVPTDCPQRDERLGWTGDIVVFLPTAAFNLDVAAFMDKWLWDLADSQCPDGAYTHVAPAVGDDRGSPGWSDAGILCPDALYQAYGRLDLVEAHYPAMVRYLAYLEQRARKHLQPALGFGDWVSLGEETPKEVIATAFYARCAARLATLAEALGQSADAQRFGALAEAVRRAFVQAYVGRDGKVTGGTQTAYALALGFDLLPEDRRGLAAGLLAADVAKRGNHLTTGFLGTPFLLPVLAATGHAGTAYDLLLQESFPSWLYAVNQGATTIWERWDSYTREGGIHEPGMNSFNHYAFGSVGEWLFTGVGGIQAQSAGYGMVRVRPWPEARLGYAKVDFRSPHGPLASHWRWAGERLELDVELPPNTTGSVWVPTSDPTTVTEGGQAADTARGLRRLEAQEGCAVFALGSGSYRFAATLPGGPR